jgi:hypothetical protein
MRVPMPPDPELPADTAARGSACACLALFVVVFNLTLGALCFQYSLWAICGKDIPWYADAACGLIGGEVVVPLAFVLWVLSFFLKMPLTNLGG